MTSQTYHADDDQLMQDHDQVVLESHLTEPEAELAVAEPALAEPDTDLAVAEVPLAEPEADQIEHEDPASHPANAAALPDHQSAAASVPDYPGFTADGDDSSEEPGMADTSPGIPSLVSAATMLPEPVAESRLAGTTAGADGPWSEIQAMFVDDPHASIERAAGLVDDRVDALIQSVRERQRSLQSTWQSDDAGTEELRLALQHHRTFWNSLEDLPAQN